MSTSEKRVLEKTNTILKDHFLMAIEDWPSNIFDLLLTDIPYGISRPNQLKTMNRSGFDYDFEHNAIGFYFEEFAELTRIIKPGGSAIIFHAFDQTAEVETAMAGLQVKDKIMWRKKNPMPRNTDRRYVSTIEMISWFVKPGAKWTFNKHPDVPYLRNEITAAVATHLSKYHPTAKPLDLIETLIRTHSNEGDFILDPLAGSFTTMIAATEAGRSAYCIELMDKYYQKGKELLAKYGVAYKEDSEG